MLRRGLAWFKTVWAGFSQDWGSLVHSIRFRLAIWFLVALSLVLVVFSGIIYYRQAGDVRRRAESRLESRAQEIQQILWRNLRTPAPGTNPSPELAGTNGPLQLQSDEIVLVAGGDGQVSGAWGSLSAAGQADLVNAVLNQPHPQPRATRANQWKSSAAGGVDYLFRSLTYGTPGETSVMVILAQPVDPQGEMVRLAWTLALAGLMTLGVATAGAYWLADTALRPIQTMIRTAQEISESDLSRRLNLGGRDEIGRLALTFDHMLDRLQAAFVRQRQFTADASHELRTPLSIIGLETERALAPGKSSAEMRRSLETIQLENQTMTRLVSELLTLARMDAGQTHLNIEELDLSDVALEVVERYALLAEQRGIRLLAGDLPEVSLPGDRSFLIQMIGNLVDNALKYMQCTSDSWVRVETGYHSSPDGHSCAYVQVADNGPGIAAEHLPHLFDRFYQVDIARTHPGEGDPAGEGGGSGLGLSIVAWIAEAHHARVQVESQPGTGSRFEVIFPLDGDHTIPA